MYGQFEIFSRGGNISAQFYLGKGVANNEDKSKIAISEITRLLAAFGGWLDGIRLVYSCSRFQAPRALLPSKLYVNLLSTIIPARRGSIQTTMN